MDRVLKDAGNNIIIILFIVVILSSTIFMGLSERRLANDSLEKSYIIEK